jgi:hypothetical protein
MEKILKPQFPKIVKTRAKVTTKNKRKVAKKKRSAVGATSKSGARRTKGRRGSRIRLTKVDQANMEIFGLDPTNPVDAKAYAANKEG